MLDGEDLKSAMESMVESVVSSAVRAINAEHGKPTAEEWSAAIAQFEGMFLGRGELRMTDAELAGHTDDSLAELLLDRAVAAYNKKEEEIGSPLMREIERVVMLRVVDEYWMDHIDAMHELRQGIGLRAFAQTDPVVAYKREGFEMFEQMVTAIREETVRRVYLARIKKEDGVKREAVAKVTGEPGAGDGSIKKQPVRKGDKVGRNDPCPCGSGKKYKKCCGANE